MVLQGSRAAGRALYSCLLAWGWMSGPVKLGVPEARRLERVCPQGWLLQPQGPRGAGAHASKGSTWNTHMGLQPCLHIPAAAPRPEREEKWVSLTNISFSLLFLQNYPNLSEESGSHSCITSGHFYGDGASKGPAELHGQQLAAQRARLRASSASRGLPDFVAPYQATAL